eukprot:s381_g18.t1
MCLILRKEIVKKQASERKPISELAAATKTALGELRKAITAFQSRAAKRSAGTSGGAERSKKAKTGNTKFLLDGGMDLASEISTHRGSSVVEDPFAIFKGALDIPVMVTLSEPDRECFKSPTILAATEYFSAAFTSKDEQANAQKPVDKRTKSRAAAKISGDAGTEVLEIFKKFFLRQGLNPAHEGQCELCEPYHFGVQGPGFSCTGAAMKCGSVMSGAEQEQLASLRLVLRGTRTVLCSPVSDVLNLMNECGIPLKTQMDSSAVWSFYMDLSEQMAQKMVDDGGKLFQCTQGVGDILYIPCGYVFAEKIGLDADCSGFVLRGLVSEANDPGAADRCRALLSRTDKVSKFFSHVLDFYSIRSDPPDAGETAKAAPAAPAAPAATAAA